MGLIFDILFGNNYSRRARRDQGTFGTSLKNMISPFNSYGTCFSCNGSGKKTFDCKPCNGTGTHHGTCNRCAGTGRFVYAAEPCPNCNGSGVFRGQTCKRCDGTKWKPANTVTCKKCDGEGTYSATCNKCGGDGVFEVGCRKCGGSGWHRF